MVYNDFVQESPVQKLENGFIMKLESRISHVYEPFIQVIPHLPIWNPKDCRTDWIDADAKLQVTWLELVCFDVKSKALKPYVVHQKATAAPKKVCSTGWKCWNSVIFVASNTFKPSGDNGLQHVEVAVFDKLLSTDDCAEASRSGIGPSSWRLRNANGKAELAKCPTYCNPW